MRKEHILTGTGNAKASLAGTRAKAMCTLLSVLFTIVYGADDNVNY